MSHELTALGFHLKQNLWLGEYDRIYLSDDIATDLNIAMTARRDGVDGITTPPGILTALRGTTVGRLISDIEQESEPAAIAVGLELLRLDSDSANNLSLAIDKLVWLATGDGKPHDVTVASDPPGPGLTVHCNNLPSPEARRLLESYCIGRKYKQRAAAWYGLVLRPGDGAIRFGLGLDYPWESDERLDRATADMREPVSIKKLRRFGQERGRKKIGRNDLCYCGSGLKYKKCHLSKG